MVNRRDFSACALALAGAVLSAPLAAQTASGARRTLLVVGDSLSAEYGLARGTGWVALLAKRLADQKPDVQVVNASISGDTTAGGRSRLPALLKQHQPDFVVVELGANDALRGLPLTSTEDNLTAMIKAVQAAGAKPLLVGIQVPPNYGTDYMRRFSAVFEKVGAATKSPVVPFFLRDVADGPDAADMFQADRIHPLAKAHPRMLENVWPEIRKLIG